MQLHELATSAADAVRASLTAAGIPITQGTEAYLAAVSSRTRCWKGVFAATAAWLAQATAQEQQAAWRGIVQVCNADLRPIAAMSRMYYFRNDLEALKALWNGLPAGTMEALRVALASNPLLLAALKDPSSGVTGLPEELRDPGHAAAVWTRVLSRMERLSRYEDPGSP